MRLMYICACYAFYTFLSTLGIELSPSRHEHAYFFRPLGITKPKASDEHETVSQIDKNIQFRI